MLKSELWRTGFRGAVMAMALLVSPRTGAGDAPPRLNPGEVVKITLENFPPILAAMEAGVEREAFVTAKMPNDYDPEKTFPMLLFLGGGAGGSGGNPGEAERFSGGNGFIAVSAPLFKRALNTQNNPGIPAIYIGTSDFRHVCQTFVRLFNTLRERVPNIAETGNVAVGFSNGAHTLAAFMRDRNLSRMFSHYIICEGGHEGKVPRGAKVLALVGERSVYGKEGMSWDKDGNLRKPPKRFSQYSRARNSTVIPMVGFGHEFPEEYKEKAAAWLRENYP